MPAKTPPRSSSAPPARVAAPSAVRPARPASNPPARMPRPSTPNAPLQASATARPAARPQAKPTAKPTTPSAPSTATPRAASARVAARPATRLATPPTPPLQPKPAPATPARRRRTWALAATVVLVGLVAVGAQVGLSQGDPNTGTIKVHDDESVSPAEQNQPHVDCADLWIEGFNMAAGSGRLFFFSWAPTGDGSLVLQDNWTADGADPVHHFLAGPFTLPPGHYRVGASNGAAAPEDFPGGMKKKAFWVEPCEANPAMECPSDLAAVANPDGSVTLTWAPVEGSDGSNIYRNDEDGDLDYLATVGPGVGSYTDNTTHAGDGYVYSVTALYGGEESFPCSTVEVTAIPEFPTVAAMGLAAGGGALALGLARRKK